MSNYPDWVNAFKEKGTSVKKIGNEYYLYHSTSKRIPGQANECLKNLRAFQDATGRLRTACTGFWLTRCGKITVRPEKAMQQKTLA